MITCYRGLLAQAAELASKLLKPELTLTAPLLAERGGSNTPK